jgi:hypothetical protein
MSHATRTIHHRAEREAGSDRAADGVVWVVLFAAVTVATLTLFAGTNLLGDRFDPAPAAIFHQPT